MWILIRSFSYIVGTQKCLTEEILMSTNNTFSLSEVHLMSILQHIILGEIRTISWFIWSCDKYGKYGKELLCPNY